MKLALLALALLLTGCLSSAPIVPITPDNTAQITSCESTASLHNGFLIGDFALTAGGASLGTVGALVSDTNAKTDLAISAAGVGAAAVLTSAIVGLTSSNFENSRCSQVVGPLPVALPAAKAPDQTTVTVVPPAAAGSSR